MRGSLLLVRHGESEGNRANRLSEANDAKVLAQLYEHRHSYHLRLSAKGRMQALAAGEWLRNEFAWDDRSYCVVSEYVRAKETAAMLGLPGVRWHVNRHLTERDWGELEGVTKEDRLLRFSRNMPGYKREPFYWRAQGGETMAEVCERVATFVEYLRANHTDTQVIVVCHGEVMWAFRIVLENLTVDEFKRLHFSDDKLDAIYNCQVIQYSGYHYTNGVSGRDRTRMRKIRPTEDPVWISDWEVIHPVTFSNEELLAEAHRHEPFFKE